MYLSIHSNYDVNLLLKQATLARSTSNKTHLPLGTTVRHPLGSSVDAMACCPWWPWRNSRAPNRESQGAGPRRQSGTMSPKTASLGLKTTKVKKRFFVLEEGGFFFDMFFGVFQWKNSNWSLNMFFVVFRLKTWSCSFQRICVTSIKFSEISG